MPMARAPERGFTLVEVLVALGIVAIALMAGLQATTALTRNAQRQSDIVLAGRPSKRKPRASARQRTGTPVPRDWARPDSSRAASRAASRSSWVCPLSRIARLKPAVASAMMLMTTSSSSSVNPREAATPP